MKLKLGVNLQDVSWRMFHAAVIAEAIYEKFGAELTITSANDGKHGEGSLHYKGLALDLRTKNLHSQEHAVAAELQQALGDEYDVVLEALGTPNAHLHVEHDPK